MNLLDRQKTRQRYQAAEEKRTHAIFDHSSSPTESLIHKENAAAVWKTLCLLERNSRVILTLKYIHDFSYEQIAQTLGIPRGTVMSRLYKARKCFKAQHIESQTDHLL